VSQTGLYEPGPHSVQVVFLPAALLEPAAHGAHAAPSAPDQLALHTQAVTAALLAAECEPSGHDRHAAPSAAA